MSGRSWFPESRPARYFFLVCVLEAVVDIALEVTIIARTDLFDGLFSSVTRMPLAVYLGIFILAHVFQLCLAWDALTVKNTIQTIGLCCFNAAFLLYAILQISEIEQIQREYNQGANIKVLLIIIPAVIGVCQIVFMILMWQIYKEFGWQIFKRIGADRRIKKMYLYYQVFICFLKFDFFFFVSFCLQLVLLVPSVDKAEKVLTIIALPLAFLLLLCGYFAVRREKRWLCFGFMFGLVAGVGYFCYKLFRIWKGRDDPSSYGNVFKSLTVFTVLCLVMSALTFATAWRCLLNFDNGLKQAMSKSNVARVDPATVYDAEDGLGMHYKLESAGNSRMSID